jgi:sigma-B regulation protein RsbU (phosphoserine phosphatase)
MLAILVIGKNVQDVSSELGTDASIDSVQNLTRLAERALRDEASNRAKLSDAQLRITSSAVKIISKEATTIMQNPENYIPREVLPPDAANDGKIVSQVVYAEGTNPSSVSGELGLLGNLEDIQKAFLTNDIDVGSMQIGTETGIMIMTDDVSGVKTSPFDPRGRGWYTAAKDENKLIWTDVFDDAFGRGLAITCAMPYYGENDEFKGVVGAGTALSTLQRTVTASNIGKNGKAFIVNERGEIIISTDITKDEDGNLVRENLAESDDERMSNAAKEMLEGHRGIETIKIDDLYYIMAYSPMSVRPWTFCVLSETNEALAAVKMTEDHISTFTKAALSEIQRIFIYVLIIFAVILVLIVLLSIRYTHKIATGITEPIITLTENVRNMGSSDDLDVDLKLTTGDEVEELADAFTDMTVRIKQYIENLTSITAEKERIGTELAVATNIQAAMLPCIFPPFPDRTEFDIYAIMEPAKEVGGDFYDFFLVNKNTLCLVIADVSGKGVPAALFMVITKTLIKNNAQAGLSPAEVFDTVNNLLCESNSADMFVTAFLGLLDIPSGRLTYANAGHNPPLIKQGENFLPLAVQPGFVLAGIEGFKFQEDEVMLAAGDALCLYTDGVTEAADSDNELFSMDRLLDVVNSSNLENLSAFTIDIKAAIDRFTEGEEQFDDITILSFRYEGANSPQFDELKIPAEVKNLEQVLQFISAPLHEKGAPKALITQIEVAAEEVFVNISKYAYKDKIGDVKILLSTDDGLTLVFSDTGDPPFNPLEKDDPDVSLSVEERAIGGLGIFMTKKIMDEVGYRYEDGQNILTLKKQL